EEQFHKLKNEIIKYNPKILEKPFLIVINKIDIVNENEIPNEVEGNEVIKISAKERINLEKLIEKIKDSLKSRN
ncbi:MAG: GTPase ObgE, partial [candidate division WOR-3 bacterium]